MHRSCSCSTPRAKDSFSLERFSHLENLVMAQQHRNPHEQENQQRPGWRERFFGDRNEDERNREAESDWDEQSGRRGFSGYSRGESEQSGWGREADENRWGQSGESRRYYQQGQQSGRSDP